MGLLKKLYCVNSNQNANMFFPINTHLLECFSSTFTTLMVCFFLHKTIFNGPKVDVKIQKGVISNLL